MERNDRPTESNEPNRREDWLDTELGSSEQRQEPSRATQPARPSFVGRMFPGVVGGGIGAVELQACHGGGGQSLCGRHCSTPL